MKTRKVQHRETYDLNGITTLAEPDTGDMGIIIEVKYAHDGDLDGACKEALKQMQGHAGRKVIKR